MEPDAPSKRATTLLSWLGERRSWIDQRLVEIGGGATLPAPLAEPVTTALRSSGKRVRGILTLAAGECSGARAARLLDAAAALEMIHASSLVLDDLPSMDDAELRRGEPTLHRRFGEDLAILASVALLNHAYGLLSRNHAAMAPRRWSSDRFMTTIVEAVGWNGTIGGESVDLHSDSATLDFETLEYIHSRKTGTLFVAAASAGAMLANAPEQVIRSIEAYAKNLGLAFQITDDILDVTSTPEELGKDVGKDESRLTFVKLAGIEGARQLNEELIETSIKAIEPLGSSAKMLGEFALYVRDRVK